MISNESVLILGAILASKYSSDANVRVPFQSLFWPSWPKCLEIYGMSVCLH